jgi:hypothetical protein
VKIFSPYVSPTATYNTQVRLDTGATVSLFDYQNREMQQLPAVPGWRGPQFGFNIDWLNPNHNGYYVGGGINGPNSFQGVIGSRMSDTFDIEIMPVPQGDGGSNACPQLRGESRHLVRPDPLPPRIRLRRQQHHPGQRGDPAGLRPVARRSVSRCV